MSSEEEKHLIIICVVVSSSLSTMGSVLNLASMILLNETEQHFFKLVLLISLMDLVLAIFELIRTFTSIFSIFTCQFLDCISAFGLFGSIVLTCCFSHYLLISLKQGSFDKMSHMVNRYWIISTIITLSLVIFRFTTTNYQILPGGLCVTKLPAQKGIDWLFMFRFAIPTLIALIFCAVCYTLTFRKIREINGEKNFGLALYPLIIVICVGPLVALGIRNQLFDGEGSFYWLFIANFLLYLQGFLNSLAYGVYRRITKYFIEKCSSDGAAQTESMNADDEGSMYDSTGRRLIVNS